MTTLSERLQRAVALRDAATAGMHGAGDGVIDNANGIGKGTWIGGHVLRAMIASATEGK